MKRTRSIFAAYLAHALERHKWELFANRSGTSLDIGMVDKVAEWIDAWLREEGWEVRHVEKDSQ